MHIPSEIISYIISMLDPRSQLEARLVSKFWLQSNNYTSLIFNWAEPGKVKDFVDHLVNYTFVKQIIFLKSKKMVKEDALALARLTNLRILRFSEVYGTRFDLSQEEWMQFSGLTNLQEFHFNGNYPATLLTNFPYLNKLDLSVKDFSVTDQIVVVSSSTNLQSLTLRYDADIIMATNSIAKVTEIRAISKLKGTYGANDSNALERFTNLKSLSWDIKGITPPLEKLTKLQYLDIATDNNPSPDLLSKNQHLTGLKLNVFASQQFFNSLTSLYKLRQLTIHEVTMPLDNFYFLTQLLQLEEFEATPKRPLERLKEEVMGYIKSPHLTKLVCKVDAEYLNLFTNLRELDCKSATTALLDLTNLTNLTVDTIANNVVLTTLKKLHIRSSKTTEFLPNPHLEELIIDSQLSSNIIPRLPAFKNLTRLQLYFPCTTSELSKVDPIVRMLLQMTKIQRLQLRRVEERYCGSLTRLSALTNLRILQISGELTAEVKNTLTNIKHLDFI